MRPARACRQVKIPAAEGTAESKAASLAARQGDKRNFLMPSRGRRKFRSRENPETAISLHGQAHLKACRNAFAGHLPVSCIEYKPPGRFCQGLYIVVAVCCELEEMRFRITLQKQQAPRCLCSHLSHRRHPIHPENTDGAEDHENQASRNR